MYLTLNWISVVTYAMLGGKLLKCDTSVISY
jgi:hypothetical protein